jgi:hypothetical protein
MVTASSASSSYVEYGYESSTFGSGFVGSGIQFGKEVKVTGLEFKNNQMALGQLYSPEIESFAYGKSEGKCSIDYVVSNPWFFQSVLGTAVPAPAANPTVSGLYQHTWNSSPSTDSTMRDIHSMALRIGFKTNTEYKRQAVGVVCPSLNLKMALNETVKASQELVWGEETKSGFSSPTGVSLAGGIPYTFVHASITSPLTGATLASVQSFDLSINSNAELIYEMGNKLSVDAYRKILEMTGKVSLVLYDATLLESVYGRGETTNDLVVTLSNGLTGTSTRNIVMTFTGCSFSSHDTTGVEPGELLIENLDFQCRHVSVVAKNEVSTIPT